MYVLDDKEKKLFNSFKGKRLRWQIWVAIALIIMGVIGASSIILIAVFGEYWQTILKPPTIKVNGLIVENPFALLTMYRSVVLFWVSLVGIFHLIYLRRFKRLVGIIDKLSGNSGDQPPVH